MVHSRATGWFEGYPGSYRYPLCIAIKVWCCSRMILARNRVKIWNRMAYFNTNRALYTEENIETASFWNVGNSERSRMNTTRLIEKERKGLFFKGKVEVC